MIDSSQSQSQSQVPVVPSSDIWPSRLCALSALECRVSCRSVCHVPLCHC